MAKMTLGRWVELACDILKRNNINKLEFTAAIRDLLQKGRKKFTNLLIVGPSNTAKSFLLEPLTEVFEERCFTSPANTRFSWCGIENADVALLQDFRYSPELIDWATLLRLLEGTTVKLPLPRNYFKNDLVLPSSNKISIFATSKDEILPPYLDDELELEMMRNRWKTYKLSYRFSEEESIECQPCGPCFSKFFLNR